MGSRMDKYDKNSDVPKRTDRNKELYKQIYNAYDDFENLVVPSNAKEIDLAGLKKEITSRDEYRKVKDYGDITNNKVVRKEIITLEQKKENEIYDINELLNKAVSDNKKEDEEQINTITTDSYLKKLKLDETRTNLDAVKEMYEEIKKETEDESEELLKTANLSLEILSDLKGENDNTMIEAPIKNEFLDDDQQFYSNKYKFTKNDFDDKELYDEEDDSLEEELEETNNNGKFFFKILLLIFGIAMVVVIGIYLFSYFNRV